MWYNVLTYYVIGFYNWKTWSKEGRDQICLDDLDEFKLGMWGYQLDLQKSTPKIKCT